MPHDFLQDQQKNSPTVLSFRIVNLALELSLSLDVADGSNFKNEVEALEKNSEI